MAAVVLFFWSWPLRFVFSAGFTWRPLRRRELRRSGLLAGIDVLEGSGSTDSEGEGGTPGLASLLDASRAASGWVEAGAMDDPEGVVWGVDSRPTSSFSFVSIDDTRRYRTAAASVRARNIRAEAMTIRVGADLRNRE